ncbi:MAG: arginine--tRNA ligase [Bacteroidetes bacterium]|nr:arginine--tRNA ligase [Bacteroidota bacterium]MBS1931793.1 arginine--tRNA ligase [Bacteroidota bacterium]
MNTASQIKPFVLRALKDLYNAEFTESELTITATRPEFEGDFTLVLFSFVKQLKKSPEHLGKEIGGYLQKMSPEFFKSYNVIKGFLNLTLSDSHWVIFLKENFSNKMFGIQSQTGNKVIVEYSSPNTNKPLHLGHLRNIFLGWSIAEILKAQGNEVIKTCVVNDRGIHICKSMVAWQLFANGATPETTKIKGDHFVGEYYVKFNDEHLRQQEELMKNGMGKEEAEKEAPIMKATQQMLLDWEAGKPEVMELWEKMNEWVYKGFNVTYKRIGADFDKMYYESNTYLLGKKFVEEGLKQGVFFRKDDGSVWIDLTAEGLDQKLVLRKDGTSVYMTQDLGLAEEKYQDYHYDQSIYVVGDEQNYHMKVLKLIMEKLGKPYADGIFHLSYGMVELPSGRMKSREGTVVDADDIINEMAAVAKQKTEDLGKVKDFSESELASLYDTIGLGALKFFLMRVDPKKKMVFNPEESVDFHGFTGPFVQYTYARIQSILRKEGNAADLKSVNTGNRSVLPLFNSEKQLIILLEQFPAIIQLAAEEHNPSVIAVYVFNLSRMFNTFYSELSVINAESEEKKQLRLQLCMMTSNIIASATSLLGIKVPERM